MALLIRNVNILVARPGLPDRGDIFISGSKISAVGNFPNAQAHTVIDGQGLYCAPGFIDVHAESDHYAGFLEHPGQEELLSQGVTAAMIGQDGVSLAPWMNRGEENLLEITGTKAFNVNWHTVEEFVRMFRKIKWGIHLGTMVGYATLRRALAVSDDKALRKKDSLRLAKLLEESLHAGACGLSAGSRNFTNPALFLSEMKTLAPVLRESRSVFAPSFLSAGENEMGLPEEFKSLGIPKLMLSDIPLAKKRSFQKIIRSLEDSPDEWFFEISPFEGVPTPIHMLLPGWAKQGTHAKAKSMIKDEWMRKKILPELKTFDAENAWILHASHNPELAGMRFSEYLALRNRRRVSEGIMALMQESGLQATILYQQSDPDLLREALRHPKALIGSRGFSIPEHHRRDRRESAHNRSAFPRYLAAARAAGVPLSEAVEKITRRPAALFEMSERGEIREGFAADLVVFGMSDASAEIKHVILGGEIAWREGGENVVRNGKVFLHKMSSNGSRA